MGDTNETGTSMQLDQRTDPHNPDADARVSVIIPLYNHEKYIEAALESVFSQTVRPMEIIVIDDGSVDASAEKMRRLCPDHPEIIFWSWPNQGAHHTLNAAILRATGDFVAILNSDDCYDPERLAACLAVVQSDPSVDVVATEVSFLDECGKSVPNPWYDDAVAFYKQEEDLALGLIHANFLVTTSNLFFRRSLFESLGHFAPLRYTHDLEFYLRLVLGKKHFHFLDRPLLAYRLHEKNTISEDKVRGDIERAAVVAFFLFRQWREQERKATLRLSLERYVEILGQQGILEAVEDFLALLEGNLQMAVVAEAGSLPREFLGFLSRLGVNWVAPGNSDPLLTEFVEARRIHLRQQKHAGRDTKLIANLKADREWLLNQRDAWEKEAHTLKEQMELLTTAFEENRAGRDWLSEQRDAWEKASHTREEQVMSLTHALRDQDASWAKAFEEIRAGRDWLSEQRDAWERVSRVSEEQVLSLTQALEEMRIGNAWLNQQRDAWESSATLSAEEIVRCHAALRTLMGRRLFRLLVRAKLLELTHLPPGSAATV